MTLPPFVDGNILYADELNQLRLELKADATQKANAARNGAGTDATAKDNVLKAHLEAYADDQDDIVRADAAADATAKDNVLKARLDILARDTGLRNITSLAENRVTSGTIILHRTGALVTLDLELLAPSSTYSSGTNLFSVPSGFRRPRRWDGVIPTDSTGSTTRGGYMFAPSGSGGFGLWQPSTSDRLRLNLSWITNDAWPSTLPGTPA